MSTARDITQYEKPFLLKLLKEMLLIRRFEEKSAQMYGLQKIGGFCHLYIGQEAVAWLHCRVGFAERLCVNRLSRSRPCSGLRHASKRCHGRTFWESDRLFTRERRIDAPV